MDTLNQLQSQLDELRTQFASIGHLRPGTLAPYQRKCGKPNCHCAHPDHRGHPGWQLTRIVDSKNRCRGIPKSALEETRHQVAEYQRFMELVKQFTELNETLCEFRLRQRRDEKKTRSHTSRPSPARSSPRRRRRSKAC